MVVQNISADINTSLTLSRCRQPKVHFINLHRCRQIYFGVYTRPYYVMIWRWQLKSGDSLCAPFCVGSLVGDEKLCKILSSGLSEKWERSGRFRRILEMFMPSGPFQLFFLNCAMRKSFKVQNNSLQNVHLLVGFTQYFLFFPSSVLIVTCRRNLFTGFGPFSAVT